MSADRRTVLLRQRRALQLLAQPDAPPELKQVAKKLADTAEAVLTLQDAIERKRQREQ